MGWFLGILVLVAIVVLVLKNKKSVQKDKLRQDNSKLTLSYQPVPALITPAEQQFLKALDGAVDDRFRVFTMVRVADVIKPTKSLNPSVKHKLFLKTSQKHFDFVICDATKLKPLCVIELNDKSHQKKKRKDRDDFLAEACASAGLPLKFVFASNSYDQSELVNFIDASSKPFLKKAA